jgi:hypothetical protein
VQRLSLLGGEDDDDLLGHGFDRVGHREQSHAAAVLVAAPVAERLVRRGEMRCAISRPRSGWA